MRILVCPDSFKGSLSALDAARAIAQGLREASAQIDCDLAPLADGGEGFVDAMLAAGGQRLPVEVTGPLGDPVCAEYALLPDGQTAVIEMAAAAGLGLLAPSARRPLQTTTYGVGEMMLAALDAGAKRLVVGIGGSATTDGGAGMAQALGAALLDSSEAPIGHGGAALAKLSSIKLDKMDPRIKDSEVLVACDVDNPLTGPSGAAVVYAPQKGASPDDVALLDLALGHYARIVRRDLCVDVQGLPGAGAAGGLGAGLAAFCGARLVSGVEVVTRALGLRERAADADWIITGEGRTDAQTLRGKAVSGALGLARVAGVPCIIVSGALDGDLKDLYAMGAAGVFSVQDAPRDEASAIAQASRLLRQSARAIGGVLANASQCAESADE